MAVPAPEMFQCSACGNGRSKRGFHFSWSLSYVDLVGDLTFTGIAIIYNSVEDKYSMSSICWDIDEGGIPIAPSVETSPVGDLEEEEYGEHALPVVWLGTPGKLKRDMYKTTLGRKEKT